MLDDNLILESDARGMVNLIADVAKLDAPLPAKRQRLMDGLIRLVDADAWAWIVSRASETNNNPAVAAFLCGGMDPEKIGRYVQLMQDRDQVPVEYAALNKLRHEKKHFTRGWDQLVTPEEWYGPANRQMIDGLQFEHVLYSVRVLDDEGYFSGISLKRAKGRPNFDSRQRRIVHIVTGETEWLHYDPNLAVMTREIVPLPPHLRNVLVFLVDPAVAIKEIPNRLGIRENTVKEYLSKIYKHFRVRNRTELLGRFFAGDGNDVN